VYVVLHHSLLAAQLNLRGEWHALIAGNYQIRVKEAQYKLQTIAGKVAVGVQQYSHLFSVPGTPADSHEVFFFATPSTSGIYGWLELRGSIWPSSAAATGLTQVVLLSLDALRDR